MSVEEKKFYDFTDRIQSEEAVTIIIIKYTFIISQLSEGNKAWPTVQDLRFCLVGVRGFKSHPSHNYGSPMRVLIYMPNYEISI